MFMREFVFEIQMRCVAEMPPRAASLYGNSPQVGVVNAAAAMPRHMRSDGDRGERRCC